jgi:hypothetical protein
VHPRIYVPPLVDSEGGSKAARVLFEQLDAEEFRGA